jgi:hypothetical protein
VALVFEPPGKPWTSSLSTWEANWASRLMQAKRRIKEPGLWLGLPDSNMGKSERENSSSARLAQELGSSK